MKLAKALVDLLKAPAARPVAKVALEPVLDLPEPQRTTVNPLLLQGLYRD